MTLVSGELKLVTDKPEVVSQVWLRAPGERLHGTGMVTTGSDSQPVKNGVVSFSALPGPLVMVLLSNGIPGSTVRLLVPDKANATLRECIEAVGLADDGALDTLEELALEVARVAAQIASADRLETWASETASAAAQAQTSKDEANTAANRANVHRSDAEKAESRTKQSEMNARQHELNAESAAGRSASAVDDVRGELDNIVASASGYADDSAASAVEAKTSEVNSKVHETGALSAAERAEFAAEETIQQVEGDFATRNYVDALQPSIDRATAEKWLTVSDVPNYEALPTGNYRAASEFLREIGIDGAYAGRFVRTYTSRGGNFTDRAEYVAGGVPYVFYQTKTSSGLGGWKQLAADVRDTITVMGEDIKRGTGEVSLIAADVPNYATLKPGSYRAYAEFLEGIGIENPRTGRLHRTWTNTSGTTFIDHVTWIESATIVHNRYRSVWPSGMSDWIDPAPVAVTSSDISAARQEAVREQLFQSRGGRVGTGGKGVVALRFDHGVPAFTEHILPMLQARGLPASQCHHVEDPEADWSQANLNFGSGIEVYSHSWTHRDTASDAEIRKEIVESRQELESLIPNAWVAGWMTPGAGAEAYDGWWAATGLEARAPFYAQELIDSTYGSADTAPAVWNTLGARHWGHRSIDRDSGFSQWQSLIDQAASTKTGVVLMVHPSFIRDSESYIDFSEYEQVLDYIVQMRDAGKIEVLTATGMSLADPSTDYRDNMLHGDLSIWTGWGDGGTRSGTPASGELKHSVSLANIGHVKGHVREFNLAASGSGVLRVRIYNSDNTLLDVTREVAVDGETTVRIPVGIPRAGSRIWFTITTVSGEVAVTDPRLQAV